MKNYTLCFAVLLLSCMHSMAQIPRRVKTSAALGVSSSDISGLSVNGKLVIATGSDLYVTDGSDAGSVLLMQGVMPRGLVRAGNQLFFIGYSSQDGYELWTTDGTTAGTHIVKDINPSGNAFSTSNCPGADNWLAVMNNEVYFPADDGATGAELWKSDGTAAGTVMVKDISAYGGSMDYTPCDTRMQRGNWGVVVNNTLYFTASDSTHGYEIWKSDGTVSGTQLLADLSNGPAGSDPYMFYAFNNRFCFQAGANFYICDGTAAGITRLSYDVAAQPDYTVLNDTLYFIGNGFVSSPDLYDLWRTDGTEAGTYSLAQGIRLPQNSPVSNRRFQLTAYHNKLYFTGRNMQATKGGLWQSDGYASTLTWLHSGGVGKLVAAGNKLYFKSRDSISHTELWYTDGTTAGTKQVVYPGANGIQGPITSSALVINGGVYVLNDSIYYTMMYDSTVRADLYRISLFPLSVQELRPHGEVHVYPNPAHTAITITGTDAAGAEIYSIAGMLQQKQAGGNTIDVSRLAPGLYFLHITTRYNQQLTERFVKY